MKKEYLEEEGLSFVHGVTVFSFGSAVQYYLYLCCGSLPKLTVLKRIYQFAKGTKAFVFFFLKSSRIV